MEEKTNQELIKAEKTDKVKNTEKLKNFEIFKDNIKKIYSGFYPFENDVKNKKKTSKEIEEILVSTEILAKKRLSEQYWNLSGLYKRLVLYMSTMLTYDTIVIPKTKGKVGNNKITETIENASYFIDSIELSKELSRIFSIILIEGCYYGIFKECSNGRYVFQDLDSAYCRTRFKSMNGLSILELDLTYFITELTSQQMTTNVNLIQLFPKIIQDAYFKYFKNVQKNMKKGMSKNKALEQGRWLLIPEDIGVVFYYHDISPLFLSTIKAIEDLNEYKGIEKSYDKSELKKLIVQKIPINDDGEPIFTLEEATELHAAIVEMLKNNPDVDVITSLGELEMLSVQDSSQANRDNLEKMERSVYNEAGVSKNLFASDGTTSLQYSQKVDLALAYDIAKSFISFLNYHVNRKFSSKKIFLEVLILPITHYNREEMFDLYLKGAQYGYSKILAGIASGIKQSDFINLLNYENNCLNLNENMFPLKSSYTSSEKSASQEGAGRPQLKETEKSEKTISNEESL